MNTPVKPWPCDIGTTRGTGLSDVEKWDVSRPPTRCFETRRVTVAPGPQEIEPDHLVAAQRQAADERAQHAAFMARQHGTGEVAEDDEPPKAPMTPTDAIALVFVLLLSGLASLSFAVIVWPYLRAVWL